MERVAVESREIAVLGYDQETSILEVTFRRGGVYEYSGISDDVYQQLLRASSIGTYFSQNIKDHYPYKKNC